MVGIQKKVSNLLQKDKYIKIWDVAGAGRFELPGSALEADRLAINERPYTG